MAEQQQSEMHGKVCIVTGATGGIGRVTARELAHRGAEVIIIGRNRERGAAAVAEAETASGGSGTFLAADLSSQNEIRRLAGEILNRHQRIDVLVNNVGGMFRRRRLSPDGIEMTFALNHLSCFLLTDLLLPALSRASAARIVNVASNAHRGVDIDFENLQGERGYRGLIAYKRSKLANICFTFALARRLAGSTVTVNALHPGFVATDIGARSDWMATITWRLVSLFAIDVEKGAQTPVYLATSEDVEGVNGQYFSECRPVEPSAPARDRDVQRKLWEVSAEMTGISASWPR
jgi:NAD(P)-dependent dehydrogenase (short-subunit alcohol dehydrogenase family)